MVLDGFANPNTTASDGLVDDTKNKPDGFPFGHALGMGESCRSF